MALQDEDAGFLRRHGGQDVVLTNVRVVAQGHRIEVTRDYVSVTEGDPLSAVRGKVDLGEDSLLV